MMNSFYPQQQPYYQPNLYGKMVTNFNEISANDVPMSGNFAYFPKADMSEIQLKRWTANGMIETVSFVPKATMPKQPTEMELLTNRVARLEEALNGANRGLKNESTADYPEHIVKQSNNAESNNEQCHTNVTT